ncbi:helix-turn-helix domain-containing protein [Paenibacillus humicus]|uniref:helix-turn-helix domain-containing protein n=1 Tax=Paenibacillus humicus TaxID=412861 RepID=UPI003D28DECD
MQLRPLNKKIVEITTDEKLVKKASAVRLKRQDHRNTLNYRLNRIYKMTGKNPHHIMELVELIFMLIHRVK